MNTNENKDKDSTSWKSGIVYTEERYSNKFLKIVVAVLIVVLSACIGSVIGSKFTFNKYDKEINQYKNEIAEGVDTKTFSDNNITKVAQEVGPSIVGISKISNSWISEAAEGSRGSGIIFDKKGYIVTNQHIVSGLSEVYVNLAGGRRVRASVVAEDFKSDIAVLKINVDNLKAAKFSTKVSKTGETIIGMGNAYGEEFSGSISVGVVSATNKGIKVDDRAYTIYQTDMMFSKDNSGGAAVNVDGEVIGIINNKLNTSREGSYIMPIGEAKVIIDALIKDGKIYTPFLGVKTMLIDEERSTHYKVPTGLGVLEVVKGTSAEKYGLKKGDIVLSVEEVRLKKITDITDALEGKKSGDSVKIKVYRDGKELTIDAILMQKQ